MEIYDIVKKLVGNIEPVGETNADDRSFDNLKTTAGLIELLINDMACVARDRISYEYSVKRSGQYAIDFLKTLREDIWFEDWVDETTKIKNEIKSLIHEFRDLYNGDLSGEAVSLLLSELEKISKI
jgi:hypothetical protein